VAGPEQPLICFVILQPLVTSSPLPGPALDANRVGWLPTGFLSPGLAQRVLLLALILGSEATVASLFLDGNSLVHKPGALTGLVRNWGAWGVRGAIGFAALFTTFAYLKHKAVLAGISAQVAQAPIHRACIAAHVAVVAIFAALSAALYGTLRTPFPPDLIAAAWVLAGGSAIACAGLALLPRALWVNLVRGTGKLWAYAFGATVLACVLGSMSRALWTPATRLTFALVRLLLHPLVRDMVLEPDRMRIGTHRFTAIVSPECSGLEGAALLLIFGILWLVLFYEESRFPQSLLLLPAAVVVLFLLNAVRIAALILIGHAGAHEIAVRGFHSQAGWIAFNSVAFGFSIAARRLAWFSAQPPTPAAAEPKAGNPTAPYLVPFLTILAAGMISRAATGDFEWLYSLRFFAAGLALWQFRHTYREISWKPGWLSLVAGTVVFVLWIALDRLAPPADGRMPPALASASWGTRSLWIALRVLAAVVTVPLAEELAFRGFLLRRLIATHFETVSVRKLTYFSLLGSSLLFGLLHGERWLAGTAAGVLYALIMLRRGRLGDAVLAHATTNALLAAYVLAFHKWYLW
jgi:exosortase E/protease (VPEID-CTERM system)